MVTKLTELSDILSEELLAFCSEDVHPTLTAIRIARRGRTLISMLTVIDLMDVLAFENCIRCGQKVLHVLKCKDSAF